VEDLEDFAWKDGRIRKEAKGVEEKTLESEQQNKTKSFISV